jgi:uncharacterized protein (TIGR03032 family)
LEQTQPARPLDVAHSRHFPEWLAERRVAIALATGAAGRLVLVGRGIDGRLSVFHRRFDAAYSLYATGQTLLLATAFQIWRLENTVASATPAAGYDRLYVPRLAYTTGEVNPGDVAIAVDGTILFANSLFSCIAATAAEHSFTPIWRPPFITRLDASDRCHLTGFALEQGLIRYVSMAAASDEPSGWTKQIADGGLVIDASTDETVTRGLALPLNPRLHEGRLWLNEAASGMFGFVHPEDGAFEEVAFCPGWLAGLEFVDGYAIVATSRTRQGRAPGGLPLEKNLAEAQAVAQTALCVVELGSGEIAHWLRFDGLPELRDLAVLRNTLQPAALGVLGQDIRRILSIGPDRSQREPQIGGGASA